MTGGPAAPPNGAAGLARRSYALLLLLIAGALICGGARLAALGGSFYYLSAGCVLAWSAGLIFLGRRMGIALYGWLLIATVGWSLPK